MMLDSLNLRWQQSDFKRKNLTQKLDHEIQLEWMKRNISNGVMKSVFGASFCWFVSPEKNRSFLLELVQVQIGLLNQLGSENLILVPSVVFTSEPKADSLWHSLWQQMQQGRLELKGLVQLEKCLTLSEPIPDGVYSALHMTIQGSGHALKKRLTEQEALNLQDKGRAESVLPADFKTSFWGPLWDLEFAFVMGAAHEEKATEAKKKLAQNLEIPFKERPFHITLAYPNKGVFQREELLQWNQRFLSLPKQETQSVEIQGLELADYGDIAFEKLIRYEIKNSLEK